MDLKEGSTGGAQESINLVMKTQAVCGGGLL